MTHQLPSRDAGYFDALYNTNPDPWNFTASPYEHQKYAATLAALGGRHFHNAFEIGCSIGVFTRRLAARCTTLLAADIAEAALATARSNCRDLPHITFANLRVPEQWPAHQTFDLIIVSEVLYFLSPPDIARVAAHAIASLAPQGVILLVNYTEQINEPCGGAEAAAFFISAAGPALKSAAQQQHEKFRIDLLVHQP